MKKLEAKERLYNLERLGAFAMLAAILNKSGQRKASRQILEELMEQMERDRFYWTLIPRLQSLGKELGVDLHFREEMSTGELIN